LRLAFADELEEATACANAMVAQSLFQKATGDGPQSVTAAIFWLKARARWSDQPVTSVDAEEMEAQVRATIAKALADDHGDSAAVH
jgi:hypothetical protein